MDGRDIGSTVLPNAPVKIFMVATAHERARRRYVENKAKGIATASLEELQKAKMPALLAQRYEKYRNIGVI